MPDTDERAIQRVTTGIVVKIGGILLGLFLAGICGTLWSTIRDVHEIKARGDLRERVRELERSQQAGPSWMREKLRDHDSRLDDLERR